MVEPVASPRAAAGCACTSSATSDAMAPQAAAAVAWTVTGRREDDLVPCFPPSGAPGSISCCRCFKRFQSSDEPGGHEEVPVAARTNRPALSASRVSLNSSGAAPGFPRATAAAPVGGEPTGALQEP